MSSFPEAENSFVLIGRIHSPFKDPDSLPIQGTANDVKGTIALDPEFAGGTRDMDGFDRLWLIYLAQNPQGAPERPVTVTPRLDQQARGVFATRSLNRPNRIGLTCVRLLRVSGMTIYIEGVDMLDGTGLLDIKPYVPRFDAYPEAWAGWLENRVPHERAWQQNPDQAAS